MSDIWKSGNAFLFVCLLCVLVPDRGGKVCEFFFIRDPSSIIHDP